MRVVPDMTGPAVTARRLVLAYGDTVALAESDFQFPEGAITALIGPNGSGKSSLLAAVTGLLRPVSGTISVLSQSPEEARRRVALVPQSTKVNDALPVTVREVVAMGRYSSLGRLGRFRDGDRRAVDESLARLDLQKLAGRHIRELSGGQRQRVFVAQGLVQQRDLLLLDEPTTGLDIISAQVIQDVIQAEKQEGRPVVLTTHDFGEAREADHVVLLANGVVAEGRPEAVFTSRHLAVAYGFDAAELTGHVHFDDAAHLPVGDRHIHGERRQIRDE